MTEAASLAGLVAGAVPSIGAAVRALRDVFAAAGIEAALVEARQLVGAELGLDLTGLVVGAERPLPVETVRRLQEAAERRLAGAPIERVIGAADFYGRSFRLSAETLVPRPDTETLVVAVLERLAGVTAPVIADLGVGSGAILVTLLAERPTAIGVGSDISADALTTARANAEAHGVGDRALLIRADQASALALRRFDAICANPPYIARAEIATLDVEVRDHDPRLALDGGIDGLDAYRVIAATAGERLVEGGLLAVEIGRAQAAAVTALLMAAGFEGIATLPDLAGRDRVVIARRPDPEITGDVRGSADDGK